MNIVSSTLSWQFSSLHKTFYYHQNCEWREGMGWRWELQKKNNLISFLVESSQENEKLNCILHKCSTKCGLVQLPQVCTTCNMIIYKLLKIQWKLQFSSDFDFIFCQPKSMIKIEIFTKKTFSTLNFLIFLAR